MFSPRTLALAALSLAAGCASLQACPGRGGPRWTEWSSPHFRLLTDVEDENDAETLATQLEHFRAAIVAAAWRDVPETGEPIEVAVLGRTSEADVFLPPHAEGLFFNCLGTGIVVAPVTTQIECENVLKHEIVHVLMRQLDLDRNAPLWYPQAWQAWLVLAATHAKRSEDKKFAEALERARSLGFRGDAPADASECGGAVLTSTLRALQANDPPAA